MVPVHTGRTSGTCTYREDKWYLYGQGGQVVPVRTGWTSGTCTYRVDKWYLYVQGGQVVPVRTGRTSGTCTYRVHKSAQLNDFTSLSTKPQVLS